jgi:anti-sigma B factor antagonist
MTHPAAHDAGLSFTSWTERGYVIAALRGDLDIASAPALREQLLSLLRPAASQLIIDLSAVDYADASGLAVLVGTGRRARLLGGFLRLAAQSIAAGSTTTGDQVRVEETAKTAAAVTAGERAKGSGRWPVIAAWTVGKEWRCWFMPVADKTLATSGDGAAKRKNPPSSLARRPVPTRTARPLASA